MDTYLTTREVAEITRTSVGYVCGLARRGELPALKLGSRTSPYRFRRSAVVDWLAQKEVSTGYRTVGRAESVD